MRFRNRIVASIVGVFVLTSLLLASRRATELAPHATVPIDGAAGFERLVRSGEDSWLLEFYDPGCSSCQAFAPTWTQLLALPWSSGVRLGTVNIAEPSGLALAKRLGVVAQGLPNLQLFLTNGEYDEDDFDGDAEDLTAEAEQKALSAAHGPKQYRVMDGTEPGVSAAVLRQRVLAIIHRAQLEELGLEIETPDVQSEQLAAADRAMDEEEEDTTVLGDGTGSDAVAKPSGGGDDLEGDDLWVDSGTA
jgi:hypothetical protein